ncbi:ATP-dependent zinc metalloprotease YME1L isoform X2 [Lycorma delicatula]|uniref:ATP-dependent zinc metalloprotease YME1L isoform X2 n=1 Tax=Lycorma delicatula TaxID=130591 RepID=UPI003F513550
MFSLQSHNQVVYLLSQLTASSPCRPTLTTCHRIRHDIQSSTVCTNSLLEAVQNCRGYPLKEKRFNSKSIKKIISNLIENPIPPWHVSYKSYNTFFENKNGFPQSMLCKPSPASPLQKDFVNSVVNNILSSAHCKTSPLFEIHVRGFKTARNMKAENVRNPGMLGRMKKVFGIKESIAPVTAVPPDPEKLKGILEADNLTTEEQQRVRVAFAEGYLAGQSIKSTEPAKSTRWLKILQQFIGNILFIAVIVMLMASASGTVFRIQIGNQVEVDPEEISVTFNDVKGADEAKQELKDVVEFLKNPEKFSALGGKLPKGVLLVGPPGTGKTLLARAVAGEAGVPFFHAAGPEFDEILVGQGARRVRDLFKSAKDRAPCVIFIDEIDSVGAKRTNSVLHPYANQTINQLLSEMDGFHQNEGVIVLGATNRRDDLDKALLRPGRFDIEVNVPTPDLTGRKEILSLYLSKILSKGVDVELLARGTTGFTGADLENMVNQAALKAAIDGAESVTMKHLENARDKVLMGPERKSRIPDEEANEITAYHEGGHAVVAYYTKDSHPLHKVTIIPRGPSLGHTAYIPEKERYHVTKSQLQAMMDTMMGGRAAEELIFGPDKITSGASSDLKQATSIATHMVKEWGMSDKAGLRTHETNNRSFVVINEVSPATTEQIDAEIRRLMQESYERAKAILKTHQKEHKMLAEALLKYETLDAEDIKAIMAGKDCCADRSVT